MRRHSICFLLVTDPPILISPVSAGSRRSPP